MTDIDKIYLIHYSHRLGFIHVQIRRKICQSLSTDAPYVGNRSRKKNMIAIFASSNYVDPNLSEKLET